MSTRIRSPHLLALLSVALSFASCPPQVAPAAAPASTHDYRSANGRFVLKVDQATTAYSVWRRSGNAEERVWGREGARPAEAFVSNEGRVVLIYNERRGCMLPKEKKIICLGLQGEVVRNHDWDDLLTFEEIADPPYAAESIFWRRDAWFDLTSDDRELAYVSLGGTIGRIDVATGNLLEPASGKRLDEIVRKALNEVRPLLCNRDPKLRAFAAMVAAALGARDTTESLKGLLADRSATLLRGTGNGKDLEEFFGVQLAAARALIKLDGPNAIPAVEAEMRAATPSMRRDLLGVMASLDASSIGHPASPHTATAKALWRRLAADPAEDIRRYAILELLQRDDARYIAEHPEVLRSKDETLRCSAFGCLSRAGDRCALGWLHNAMKDPDFTIRLYALRGLIRLGSDDIQPILKRELQSADSSIRMEAIKELVRRGDAAGIETLLAAIRNWNRDAHGDERGGPERIDIRALCAFVAEVQLDQARQPLLALRNDPRDEIRRAVCGALAALGDDQARADLRRLALKGPTLARIPSILMLGWTRDQSALPVLAALSRDGRPTIRVTAAEATRRLRR